MGNATRRLIFLCLLAALETPLSTDLCHADANDQKQSEAQPSTKPVTDPGPKVDLPSLPQIPLLPLIQPPNQGPVTRGVMIRVAIRVTCNLDPDVPPEQEIGFEPLAVGGVGDRLRLLYRGATELGQGESILRYENFAQLPVGRYQIVDFPGIVIVRDWSAEQPVYASSSACRQRRRAGPPPPSTTYFSHLNTLQFEIGPRTVAVDFQATLGPNIGELRFETPPEPCLRPPCM